MDPLFRFDKMMASAALNYLAAEDEDEKVFWRRLMNEIIDEKNRIKNLKSEPKNAEEKI